MRLSLRLRQGQNPLHQFPFSKFVTSWQLPVGKRLVNSGRPNIKYFVTVALAFCFLYVLYPFCDLKFCLFCLWRKSAIALIAATVRLTEYGIISACGQFISHTSLWMIGENMSERARGNLPGWRCLDKWHTFPRRDGDSLSFGSDAVYIRTIKCVFRRF